MNLKSAALGLLVVASVPALAQSFNAEEIFTPRSSMLRDEDRGVRAHTNYHVNTIYANPVPEAAEFIASLQPTMFAPGGLNPSQVRAAYGNTASGSGVVAIVLAYHYPTALNDFNVFSKQFGLTVESSTDATLATNKTFQVVYASGSKPPTDTGWAQEGALDIEWSHAMAPGAKIVLVEAASASFADLSTAINKAKAISGVSQVSMSWGGNEFSSEYLYDSFFANANGVTFFASSGDAGGVSSWPAQSPLVVGVGGTSLKISGTTYTETAWSGSGGGESPYEAKPAFQSALTSLKKRGGPDVAAVADPYTGVAVYCSTANAGYVGWLVFGGTSASSPICAGLANAGGQKRGSGELAWIYAHTSGFKDITSGKAGSYSAGVGWDKVTGWGSPKAPASF